MYAPSLLLVGVRWTCVDCPEGSDIDLCDRCDRTSFRTAVHDPALHQLVAVTQPEQYYGDDEYTATMGEYSYLDPVRGVVRA